MKHRYSTYQYVCTTKLMAGTGFSECQTVSYSKQSSTSKHIRGYNHFHKLDIESVQVNVHLSPSRSRSTRYPYWLNGWIDWWIDGLMDWWIDGLMDWWIDGLMDWGIEGLRDWGIEGLRDWGIEGLINTHLVVCAAQCCQEAVADTPHVLARL